MNYFEFYGFPVSFQIDREALKRAYYQNSKKFHPDFHTLADEEKQSEMLELSTLNNLAFRTLSDDDALIRYVLEINGMMNESEKQPALPPDFLMEIMEINEALDALSENPDSVRIESCKKQVKDLENELVHQIEPILKHWRPTLPHAAADLKKVQDFFLKKRYLLRILENINTFAPAF